MQKQIDKIVIIAIALALAFFSNEFIFILIPFLSILILSSSNSLLEQKKFVKYISLALVIFVSFFYIQFIVFLPVLFYDFDYKNKLSAFCFLSFTPFIVTFNINLMLSFMILAVISIFLNLKTSKILFNEKRYFSFKDQIKEIEIKQNESYEKLVNSQSEKINSIKLEERNLIAAEIHDNVGHLLSSSILLTGALLSTSKEEKTKESLTILQTSLKTAMTSIRESVHNIHKDVYNLEAEIVNIINRFTFCDIELSYNITSFLENNKCRHITSIIKESLTNIIKHSNATKVSVVLNELPAFFQLIISDNGTVTESLNNMPEPKSIKERVDKLGGLLNISTKNGFRVFISFKKETN